MARSRAGGSPFADDERSDARERALLLFYEADTKRVPVAEIVAAQVSPIDDLTQLLVEIVTTVLMLLGLRWLPKRVPTRFTWPGFVAALPRRARDLAIAVAAGSGLAALAYAACGDTQALTRLIMLRVAAGDPEEEKKLEKSLATRVDWKVVRENDQKLGPKVRALFPFATAQPRGLPATSPSSAPATR